jgi:hypothetical protein
MRWLKGDFFNVKAKTDTHLAGEEKLFYPTLQQKEELCDLINHAFEEYNQIKSISSELESMDAGDQNRTSKIKELNDAINHHVQEEKNKGISVAQKVLSQDKAQEIAQRYMEFSQSFKQQQQLSMR